MSRRVLLVSALLSCCTGEPPELDAPERGHDPHRSVAFVGGNIVLPCSVKNPDRDFPTIEWSKDGPKPNIVFLFRDGCETHEMKSPAFEHRTSFVMKNLKDGDVSLRISDVQLTDAGTYQCKKIWHKDHQHNTTVELVVVSLSDPELSVVSPESGGVALQCEARCWLQQSVIGFLDDQGNHIPAEDQISHQEANGCFTVRRNVTLKTSTKSVTCRAEQLELNVSRDTEILIPVDFLWSCRCTTHMAVVGAVVFTLTALACGAAVLVGKKCGSRTDHQKSMMREESGESAASDRSEYLLLQRGRTSTTPPQDRGPGQAELRPQDRPTEATFSIGPLTSPPPPPPPQSAQSDHQRPPLQRQNSITACAPPPPPPAAAAAPGSSSSAAPSKKHPGPVSRSLSFSDPNHARTLRRSSSVLSYHGYTPLTHVNEE